MNMWYLLGTNLLLSPSRETSIALDGKAIATIATTEATDARAQTSERALLRGLGLLNGCEGTLGESRETHGTRVLRACVEVRWSEKATNGGRTRHAAS